MKIDVTNVNHVEFIKEVYNLSSPQGMGFLHYQSEALTDEEAKEILKVWEYDRQFFLHMDYVRGRACKMTIFRGKSKLFIQTPWYDHDDSQLKELLKRVLLNQVLPKLSKEEHGIACNCETCQNKHNEWR